MNVVGVMAVKDEADLLQEVLDDLRGKIDCIYAYDDGSIDDTYKILCQHELVKYVKQRDKEREALPRGNYAHLFNQIKKDFKGLTWCVITMGDRFFLNKTPRRIAEEAEAGEFEAVEGVQLDFLRHRATPWTRELDTYPKWPTSLRRLCRWFTFDELCIVAFKIHDGLTYIDAKYPWPRGIRNVQYQYRAMDGKISLDMPYLEHPGRRSPAAFLWRTQSKSRPLSKKLDLSQIDLTSWEGARDSFKKWYLPYKVLPWVGLQSLDKLVSLRNEDNWQNSASRRYFFWGIEEQFQASGLYLPDRVDI